MATDKDAAMLADRMRQACDPGRLNELEMLFKRYGYFIVDASELPVDERGRQMMGLYDPESGAIYLSRELLCRSAYDVLYTYLHELTHAGVWTGGGLMMTHDRCFGRAAGLAYAAFGVDPGPAGRHYDIHEELEAEERVAAKVRALPWVLVLFGLCGGVVAGQISLDTASAVGGLLVAGWLVWKLLEAV